MGLHQLCGWVVGELICAGFLPVSLLLGVLLSWEIQNRLSFLDFGVGMQIISQPHTLINLIRKLIGSSLLVNHVCPLDLMGIPKHHAEVLQQNPHHHRAFVGKDEIGRRGFLGSQQAWRKAN